MARIKTIEPTKEIICPNGHPLDSFLLAVGASKYCILCGTKLTVKAGSVNVFRCSKCNTPVNEAWQFCPHCGEKL